MNTDCRREIVTQAAVIEALAVCNLICFLTFKYVSDYNKYMYKCFSFRFC